MRTDGDANWFQRAMQRWSTTSPAEWMNTRVPWHRVDRLVYRVTKGRATLTGPMSGRATVMLTTTGAGTGEPRTCPMLGLPDGDRVVVIASNYGRPRNPAWYHNLRAHPSATLVVPPHAPRRVRAREAEGAERDRLWALAVRSYPPWEHYVDRAAGRRIPVMVLEPDDPAPS